MQKDPNLEPKETAANIQRSKGRRVKGSRDGVESKRSVAKIGMTLSLGALITTGLMRGQGAKILHIWSGVALIGFSAWHYHLYRHENREN
jgi:hypothetical protein